ncbi:MAG: response regulator [Spirochaetales bacterium]|nr:response regulator [Spirochaetales bacterium]
MSGANEDSSPSAGVTVLIVEDENIVALDMKYRLEALGYSVCAIVATGEAAIHETLSRKPDLVLMDIQLKGTMDGVEAAGTLRASSEIPIVFVTAYTDDATLERVKGAGAYGYIVKPYHECELKISIELALSKYRYERELRSAKELAEASDRAKTRFLSNISHELKTPLNSIIGFLDLAGAVVMEDELAEYVSLAARGARRLENLITSILDYTKLETGSLSPVLGDVELDLLLRRCWEPFAYDASAKGLAARLYLDPDLPRTIMTDSGKLCTLIRNLLDNAVKFTDSGDVLLSAVLESSAKHDGRTEYSIAIRVTDTGPGIPGAQRDTMYKLFTQGDDSPTRAYGGAGLGLSLAKGLADMLGVRLECACNTDTGTSFTLRISLPASYTPAFPPVPDTAELRPVALFGLGDSTVELLKWAPRLGIRLVPIEGAVIEAQTFDAVIAYEEAWKSATPAARLLLIGDDVRKLVLLGSACSRDFTVSEHGASCLPYPPSLATVAYAVEKALDPGTVHAEPMSAAAPVVRRIASSGENRPGDAGGSWHDFERLFESAAMEAGQAGLDERFASMVQELSSMLRRGDGDAAERAAKKCHDDFADNGSPECAKFALAVSIDSRKCRGPDMGKALASMIERRK